MLRLCFKRCVSAPDARLSDKQRRCLDACTSSFLEGFSIAVSIAQQCSKYCECWWRQDQPLKLVYVCRATPFPPLRRSSHQSNDSFKCCCPSWSIGAIWCHIHMYIVGSMTKRSGRSVVCLVQQDSHPSCRTALNGSRAKSSCIAIILNVAAVSRFSSPRAQQCVPALRARRCERYPGAARH